jgi:hypothetical protein
MTICVIYTIAIYTRNGVNPRFEIKSIKEKTRSLIQSTRAKLHTLTPSVKSDIFSPINATTPDPERVHQKKYVPEVSLDH